MSRWQYVSEVFASLRRLQIKGTKIYWCCGNRDFLLNKKVWSLFGAVGIADPHVITVAGSTFFISHGDQFCLNDKAYMRFRRWTQKRWLRQLFLALPFFYRLKIAKRLRRASESRMATQVAAATTMDVDEQAIVAAARKLAATHIIHGHTHNSKVHHHQGIERWVLSDWDMDHAQRGNYLAMANTGELALHQVTMANR